MAKGGMVFRHQRTVKVSMFVCPLFCKLGVRSKTAKVKDANIDTKPSLMGTVCCMY